MNTEKKMYLTAEEFLKREIKRDPHFMGSFFSGDWNSWSNWFKRCREKYIITRIFNCSLFKWRHNFGLFPKC
jgi:hypothetical protein